MDSRLAAKDRAIACGCKGQENRKREHKRQRIRPVEQIVPGTLQACNRRGRSSRRRSWSVSGVAVQQAFTCTVRGRGLPDPTRTSAASHHWKRAGNGTCIKQEALFPR